MRLAALPVASAPVLIGSRVVGGFGGHGESWHVRPRPLPFLLYGAARWGPPIMSLLRAPDQGARLGVDLAVGLGPRSNLTFSPSLTCLLLILYSITDRCIGLASSQQLLPLD